MSHLATTYKISRCTVYVATPSILLDSVVCVHTYRVSQYFVNIKKTQHFLYASAAFILVDTVLRHFCAYHCIIQTSCVSIVPHFLLFFWHSLYVVAASIQVETKLQILQLFYIYRVSVLCFCTQCTTELNHDLLILTVFFCFVSGPQPTITPTLPPPPRIVSAMIARRRETLHRWCCRLRWRPSTSSSAVRIFVVAAATTIRPSLVARRD